MKLPGRLLLVSLVFLVLPWAGCQYLREVESALRQGQARTLLAVAGMTADVVEARQPASLRQPRTGEGQAIYAHRLSAAPVLDGYIGEWTLPDGAVAALPQDPGVRYAAATRAGFLYLHVAVDTDQVRYREPGIPGDQLTVATAHTRFTVAARAPGRLRLPDHPRVAGAWSDTSRGFQVELRLPLSEVGTRLGFRAIRHQGPAAASFADEPGPLVRIDPELDRQLAELRQADARLAVINRDSWLLAAVQASGAGDTEPAGPRGLAGRLYSLALGDAPSAEPLPAVSPGRIAGIHVEQALSGRTGQAWYRTGEDQALLAVAVPVRAGKDVLGAVVAEQDTRAILTLRDQALTRLLGLTVAASLAAGGVLLAFALILSLRIRRLAAATGDVRAEGALVPERLPGTGRRDELGDLARRFETLLGRVAEHNRYLETLGQKLSHELRTPIAVVRSSLDNLEAGHLDDQTGSYVRRARQGTDRLSAIVQALGAATRLDEALSVREHETVRLDRLVADLVEAYASAHRSHRLALDMPATPPLELTGSPDLLAQMVDKLVENAVDFTPAGETITIILDRHGSEARLSVSNPGPPLPEGHGAHLFDRLVSLRDNEAGDTLHLGLGLYVARTIARHHGGDIMAANTADGVRFTARLPLSQETPLE